MIIYNRLFIRSFVNYNVQMNECKLIFMISQYVMVILRNLGLISLMQTID